MQLISLTFGGNWHIFSPANIPFNDEHYGFWVLVEQVRRFGPFNDSFEEIADAKRLAICTGATVYIQENQKWLPFSMSEDDELARSDRDFIAKKTKLDPRLDRRQGSFCMMRGSTHEATEGDWSLGSDWSQEGD